jgi:hypothetical protein
MRHCRQRLRSGLSASGFDCAGWALLTGSDAGNVLQGFVQLVMHFPVGLLRLLRIFGVFIFWRRIELLRPGRPPMSGIQRLPVGSLIWN